MGTFGSDLSAIETEHERLPFGVNPTGNTYSGGVISLASGTLSEADWQALNEEANRSQPEPGAALTVWRVLDGKRGHEMQTAGLVEALTRRRSVEVHEFAAWGTAKAWTALVLGVSCFRPDLPAPDLIVGAGHRTHATILPGRRIAGGRAVVLMHPSLPLNWFDLCLIPEHDNPPDRANVIATTGVLNTIRPAQGASSKRGLILIGGPSSNHRWDPIAIIHEVENLTARQPDVEWTLTTSRRTPDETERSLGLLDISNLSVVPFRDTEAGWVNARLEECGRVWVSEDSMSMIYEASTAGAEVGVIGVPRLRKDSRVARAVDRLRTEGRVQSVSGASTVGEAAEKERFPPLAEADRCADLILKRLEMPV